MRHSPSADTSARSGKILLAAYYFPPDAAVGALRVAKFARLLPEFGWEPHVLTVRDDLREQGLDQDRLRGLERVVIVRTGELPRVVESVGRLVARLKRRPSSDQASASQATAGTTDNVRETLSQRLTRYVVSLLLLLPDEKKNWGMRAAVTAVRLVRQRHIDWVFTSGPPFSGHFIGLVVKLCTGARWVADFRDPWIDLLSERFPHIRSRASDRLERWMEMLVVRWADRVTTTTERMRNAMQMRYSSLPASRFVCVPNSIDSERFERSGPTERYRAFTITYAGALYFDRTPEPLFQAVGELIASGRLSPADIKIKLLGNCRFIQDIDTATIADRYGLREVVEVIDRLPYAEAIEVMQRSHVLLVLAPARHQLVVPAKIFDYLGAGATILALAEPGATADLIDETQCGRWFSQSDSNGLKAYVAELFEKRTAADVPRNAELFGRYEARSVTGRLVAELTQPESRVGDDVMVST